MRLDLWSDVDEVSARFKGAFGMDLPAASRAASQGDLRVIWCEPKAWMIAAPLVGSADLLARLADIAGPAGAVTDISGAAVRCSLTGPDWRALLTHGGVFDAEDPTFGPGCVAGTIVEHINIRIDVVSRDQVDVYMAPSYAADLLGYWETVAWNLAVNG